MIKLLRLKTKHQQHYQYISTIINIITCHHSVVLKKDNYKVLLNIFTSWIHTVFKSEIFYTCSKMFLFAASTEQIDAAKEVLKKLKFTYSSESFENPVLQKHWRNIEALALDRDAPEEMVDYTCRYSIMLFLSYLLV